MRKLEGLHFLQERFPKLTVDCVFEEQVDKLNKNNLSLDDEKETIWRVRTGKRIGSELNTPQGTFKKIDEIKKFIQENKNSNTQFVIHRVTPDYFKAPFVGTIAVYNNYLAPSIKIEVQKVTQELVDSIDKKKRPRDWDSCLILEYEFLKQSPKIWKKEADLNLQPLKAPIYQLYQIGEQIFKYYEKEGKVIDTYTRFNIYDSGQVLLDDHRSSDSFIEKYRYPVSEMRRGTKEKVSKKKEIKSLEI